MCQYLHPGLRSRSHRIVSPSPQHFLRRTHPYSQFSRQLSRRWESESGGEMERITKIIDQLYDVGFVEFIHPVFHEFGVREPDPLGVCRK